MTWAARRLKRKYLLKFKALKKIMKGRFMSEAHPGYRIFVLGAGFSVPAGLPMAAELFKEIRKRIIDHEGPDNRFQRSLDEYIQYRKKCDGVTLTEDDVDLEEFMSFLDIEHFLRLEGSDTLSEHGNAAQLFVKRFIGQIIHELTPKTDELPQEYYDFAEGLSVNDIVITLNYDVILERALEHVGKPYRLFPNRFKSIGESYNYVDSSKDEVVILKLHGSLDWFSDKSYLQSVEASRKQKSSSNPHDPIFNSNNRYGQYPLVDGPRSKSDPLLNLYRLAGVDEFYSQRSPEAVPIILSPSHMKIVYANPFLDFWHGLGQAGGGHRGVNIIGFSLPEHDEYIQVLLYKIISNFQEIEWDTEMLGALKDNVKLIDFRSSEEEIVDLMSRYKFIDPNKMKVYLDGFSKEAVQFLFENTRLTNS